MRRTLLEILHIAAGLAGAALIASLAAWAVPNARGSIWWVAWVSMAAIVGMSIPQFKLARADDRAAAGATRDEDNAA